jgi:rhodanese-related sulfurtransferase
MDRYIEFILNHYILVLALAVVTYLLIQEIFDTAFNKSSAITPLTAVAKMNKDEDMLIIDVREPAEFVTSHIEQATNIPLGSLAEKLPTLTAHKNRPVLVTCQNGTRSASAAKQLGKAGFEQVFVLAGGVTAWEEDYKLPVKIASKNKKANI